MTVKMTILLFSQIFETAWKSGEVVAIPLPSVVVAEAASDSAEAQCDGDSEEFSDPPADSSGDGGNDHYEDEAHDLILVIMKNITQGSVMGRTFFCRDQSSGCFLNFQFSSKKPAATTFPG